MNILVTGANGQLGNEMRIATADSPHRYFFTDIEELDITDSLAVDAMVDELCIDMVVNCAAYTNVDRAEDDLEMASRLNSDAVAILAESMKRRDGWVIHISTDYVFGGNMSNTPRTEDEPANPTGVYGMTKLMGEKSLEASGCQYIILRTSWLYSEFGKNFVKTMLNLTESRPELKVVFDQVGTPTYALDLANAIVQIIDSGEYESNPGTYHYSNEGVCSWFDFAKMIAALSHHDSCNIVPCHSSEFPSKVVRPSFSVLDKTKVKSTFHLTIPYWVDSLAACLANIDMQQS